MTFLFRSRTNPASHAKGPNPSAIAAQNQPAFKRHALIEAQYPVLRLADHE